MPHDKNSQAEVSPQGLILFSALQLLRRAGFAAEAQLGEKLLREGKILPARFPDGETRGLTTPQTQGGKRRIFLADWLFDPQRPHLSTLLTAATLAHELIHWQNIRSWPVPKALTRLRDRGAENGLESNGVDPREIPPPWVPKALTRLRDRGVEDDLESNGVDPREIPPPWVPKALLPVPPRGGIKSGGAEDDLEGKIRGDLPLNQAELLEVAEAPARAAERKLLRRILPP